MQRGTVGFLGLLLLASGELASAPRLSAEANTTKPIGEAASRSVSTAAQGLLREEFRYDPSIRQRASEKAAAEPDVVEMAPFVISESKTDRALDHALAQQRDRHEAQKPSVANGISVPGIPSLGVKPYKDVMPFGAPMARVSLFKLEW